MDYGGGGFVTRRGDEKLVERLSCGFEGALEGTEGGRGDGADGEGGTAMRDGSRGWHRRGGVLVGESRWKC